MWRSRRFIIIAVVAAVVLAGSIGGVALAQTEDEDSNPQNQQEALLEKVCAIYEENTGIAIDVQALQGAFTQAQSEMRSEAMDEYLQKLVEEGKITQEQADQYKAWWEARPDIPLLGMDGLGMSRGFGGPGGPGGEPQFSETADSAE